jgi:hypothetical protein
LNLTVTPSFSASNAVPIVVNEVLREAAANTVMVVDVLGPATSFRASSEQAERLATSAAAATRAALRLTTTPRTTR